MSDNEEILVKILGVLNHMSNQLNEIDTHIMHLKNDPVGNASLQGIIDAVHRIK